jgi:hypothetical protein
MCPKPVELITIQFAPNKLVFTKTQKALMWLKNKTKKWRFNGMEIGGGVRKKNEKYWPGEVPDNYRSSSSESSDTNGESGGDQSPGRRGRGESGRNRPGKTSDQSPERRKGGGSGGRCLEAATAAAVPAAAAVAARAPVASRGKLVRMAFARSVQAGGTPVATNAD